MVEIRAGAEFQERALPVADRDATPAVLLSGGDQYLRVRVRDR